MGDYTSPLLCFAVIHVEPVQPILLRVVLLHFTIPLCPFEELVFAALALVRAVEFRYLGFW